MEAYSSMCRYVVLSEDPFSSTSVLNDSACGIVHVSPVHTPQQQSGTAKVDEKGSQAMTDRHRIES